SLDNLGTTLDAQGKQTDFLAADRESLEIIESLIGEFPNVPSYQVSLGAKNCNTGIHLLENGLPAESLPYFDKAVATLRIVLARDSRIESARQFLANSYGSMGRALDKLERHTEAIAALDQATEWVAESRKPSFVFMKARVVSKTQPEHAKSLVEEYLRCDAADPDMRYNAACFYSHLASITTDKSDQDRHVQRALQLLTQARDQGFFTPPQVAHFRSDSDFTFLRSHVDFQAFEMSLPIAPPQK
ncbi:MAG: tetratricopeptide repeat protein, partial [Pirellulaceae bacterium]|nr:tetratricopeptide repeat protein [Pirellulaceae bacterium]